MSLYEDLGVSPDATPEEIKAAGRRRSKETHPDRGGEPEAFHRVQRALAVLRDPLRRETYDRTGEAYTGSPEAQESAEARALLQMIMVQVMEEGDARFVDLPKRVRERLGQMQREASAQKSEHHRKAVTSLNKLQAYQKRLKKKGAGEDALGAMLDGQIASVQRSLAQNTATLDRRMRIVDRAMVLAHGYEYEVDIAPQYAKQPSLVELMEQEYRRQGGFFGGLGGGPNWRGG